MKQYEIDQLEVLGDIQAERDWEDAETDEEDPDDESEDEEEV